jgi:hypothetical protein
MHAVAHNIAHRSSCQTKRRGTISGSAPCLREDHDHRGEDLLRRIVSASIVEFGTAVNEKWWRPRAGIEEKIGIAALGLSCIVACW